jgi:tetratricopeptide (TPR) repeat protein
VQSRTWLLEVLESTGELPAADSVARLLEARRDRLSPLEQAQLDEYTSSIRGNPTANLAATFRMHALAPNGQWRATLARKLMLANRWQEALDTLKAAPAEIGLFKDKPYPLEQQRSLLHRLGRHTEELTVAQELVRRFKTPRLQFELARTYAALGQADSARVLAERIAASTPDAGSSRNLLRTLADEMRWHGHDAAANQLLEAVLASYDRTPADSATHPSILRGRAETLARLGRWSEALNIVRPFASSDTALGTRLSMAIGSAHTGDNALADKLDAELAAMPVDPYRPGAVLYLRARLSIARGDRASAVALLKAAQAKALPLYDVVHGAHEFQALRGDPAFDALLKPAP